MTDIIDVLICGAGPVGCFFANLMDQAGHNFRIIDNTTFESRLGQSRATMLTARSLEILQDRGLSADALRNALVLHGMRLYTNTKQVNSDPLHLVCELYLSQDSYDLNNTNRQLN
jgi:2-polyprenyl-6-methoxyphenol hydroxylase-like FAD-dependent oxidoreductase